MSLVDDGVHSVAEMRRHIHHYVRTELFPDGKTPTPTDRRFFPTATDFRNYIYQARRAKLHSKVDQTNLKLSVAKWREKYRYINDCFFFQEYTVTDGGNDELIGGGTTVRQTAVHRALQPS